MSPTARTPPAPTEIVEITPTFGWTRAQGRRLGLELSIGGRFASVAAAALVQHRLWRDAGRAGGLRQPLHRPDHRPESACFVTQWGVDPIWRSGVIDSPSPTVERVPLRLLGGPIPAERSPEFVPDEERQLPSPFPALTNLELPESGGTLVNVAAHPVCYDPKRQLYYCAS